MSYAQKQAQRIIDDIKENPEVDVDFPNIAKLQLRSHNCITGCMNITNAQLEKIWAILGEKSYDGNQPDGD